MRYCDRRAQLEFRAYLAGARVRKVPGYMTGEHWRSAYDLFQSACDLSPEQREEFLQTLPFETRELIRGMLEDLRREETLPQANEWQETGRTLGRFYIESPLGRGGMGQVYRAVDKELNRAVAMKFLQPSDIGTASKFESFLREAQAISALNHPNIVTVHEVIRSDSTTAIVMELVEGTALRKLTGKPASIEQIARWGVQIAQGLEAAHARGIVHRDIKPENLMLRSDGLIKILDFGLARKIGSDEVLDELPMGTLGYMSPEQLRGDPLTPATDMFSLGTVLWELATGTHPFLHDTPIATTRAISRQDPTFELPAPSPLAGRFEKSLRKLLSKDPSLRPSASQTIQELESILRSKEQKFQAWLWAATFCGAIALGAVFWFGTREAPQEKQSPQMVPFTAYEGSEADPAFSPDGSRIAFAWTGEQNRNRNIYTKGLTEERPTQISSDPADEFAPVWSPDGKQIAFLRRVKDTSTPEIVIVPAGGGSARVIGRIADPEGFPRPIAWWPDGSAILSRDATDRGLALVRISITHGDRQILTSPPAVESDGLPVLAPDGKRFAFVRLQTRGALVCLLSLDTRVECIHSIHADQGDTSNGLIGGLAWLPDGKGLLYSDRSGIWRLKFGREPKVSKVMEGNFTGLTGDRQGKRLGFTRQYVDTNLWQVETKAGSSSRLLGSSTDESDPAFSPDGKWICFRSSRTGSYELWITRADGTEPRKVTSFGGHLGSVRWSPDGKWLAFDGYGSLNEKTRYANIYTVAASGGVARRVTDDAAEYIVPNWSRDQKWLYCLLSRGAQGETWKFPVEGGKPVLVSPQGMFDLAESDDGKWLYFTQYRGEDSVWKQPVAGGPAEIVPGTERVRFIRYWQLAGRQLFFADGMLHPKLLSLDLSSGKTRTIGSMGGRLIRGPRGLTVSPDGSKAVYTSEDIALSDIVLIEKIF